MTPVGVELWDERSQAGVGPSAAPRVRVLPGIEAAKHVAGAEVVKTSRLLYAAKRRATGPRRVGNGAIPRCLAAHADLLEEGASDLEPRAVCAVAVEDLILRVDAPHLGAIGRDRDVLEVAVDLAPRAVGARTVVDIIFRGDAPHVQPILCRIRRVSAVLPICARIRIIRSPRRR